MAKFGGFLVKPPNPPKFFSLQVFNAELFDYVSSHSHTVISKKVRLNIFTRNPNLH